MDRAVGVGQSANHIQSMRLGTLDRNLEIAHVVQRIVWRVVAHAVCREPFGRQFDDVVSEKLERKKALPARVNDERRFGDPGVEDPHALPGVFPEITHHDVEHGTADKIDGFETGLVQAWRDVLHHGRRHPGRPQALVGIAKRDVDQANIAGHAGPPLAKRSMNAFSTQRV